MFDRDPRSEPAWPYWLAAFAIAIVSAEIAFRLAASPEPYSQFTVGAITWRAAGKRADYFLLLGLVVGFVSAWGALLLLESRIHRRLGPGGVRELRALAAYASLPLVIWASRLLWPAAAQSRELVMLSAALVLGAMIVMFVATFDTSAARDDVSPNAPHGWASWVLLLALFGALSAILAVFALNRFAIPLRHTFIWNGTPRALTIALAGALAVFASGLWARRGHERMNRRLGIVLVAAQALLPLGLLTMMPLPWLGSESTLRYPTDNGQIPWLIVAFVAGAYIDLVVRARHLSRKGSPDLLHLLSPLALAGALLFVKLEPLSVSNLYRDDYHFGEFLLPWWSLTTFGAVPFWDHVPARGLINYVDFAVASISFCSTAAGVEASLGIVSAIFLIVALLALGKWMGLLPAAVALVGLPVTAQPAHIDMAMTTLLVVLLIGYSRLTVIQWLVSWSIAMSAGFLLAPAQGLAMAVATSPVVAWQLWRALRSERARLLRTAAIGAVVAVLLLLVTPLGRMFVGAIRYGREHAAVAGAAHGIDWAASADSFEGVSRWVAEAVRTSWIALGFVGGAMIVTVLLRGDRERRERVLLVAIPITLLAIFFIPRAAGRIDPAWPSRLGFASAWMLSLLLPMLLHAWWGNNRWHSILPLTVIGGGLLVLQAGNLLEPSALAHRALDAEPRPAKVGRAIAAGLANIGVVGIDSYDRLTAIHEALGLLLDRNETYLDLTNRNAHYFFLNREIPIESGAIYNLPHDEQQMRAIAALQKRQVSVILANAENLLFDGVPPSYRVYAIYRYVVQRYVPARIGTHLYLVKPERLRRLEANDGIPTTTDDPLSLLDGTFRLDNLQGLPKAWGASWTALQVAATRVTELDPKAANAASGSSSLRWDFSSTPLRGKDAGILTFNYECLAGPGTSPLEVRWAAPGTPGDGRTTVRFEPGAVLAVPLDASPRWLLAPAIGELEIRVVDPNLCGQFAISNAALWQRHTASVVDAY